MFWLPWLQNDLGLVKRRYGCIGQNWKKGPQFHGKRKCGIVKCRLTKTWILAIDYCC